MVNLNQVVVLNLIHFHIPNISPEVQNLLQKLQDQTQANNHLNYLILIKNLSHPLRSVLSKQIC